MLGLSLTVSPEPVRAVAAAVGVGLLVHAGVSLRKAWRSRRAAVLLGLAISTVACALTWSVMNVARFYLYDSAAEQVGSYPIWFEIVLVAQTVLQWCAAVAALGLLVVLAGFPLWTRFHGRAPVGKLR